VRHRLLVLLLVVCVSLCFVSPEASAESRTDEIRIENSTTWVGIARVHLEVEGLRWVDESLNGTFRLRVPMSPKKNESGTIELASQNSLDDVRATGGTLVGSAYSDTTGKIHAVVCDVAPNGTVHIRVTTEKRILDFESRYHAVGGS
jgi:hypothetical protein